MYSNHKLQITNYESKTGSIVSPDCWFVSVSLSAATNHQKTKITMPRSVNHVASRARRKKVMKLAKGFYGRRKNVWTVAKNAVEKALGYAYIGRKQKKRHFRALWIQRINAGARQEGLSYSVFMGKVHAAGVELNRKVLADLAMNHPEAFKAVVEKVK
jgi:large subunit ribosomal protein L20